LTEPLWKLIEDLDAYMPVYTLLRRRLIATLIRAMRDWLYDKALREGIDVYERNWLHRSLSEEAAHAEAGE
jgi:hypothetical protein